MGWFGVLVRVCVCVLLRGGSNEVSGAVGGIFWVEIVNFVCVVLRVRGFLTIL